MKDAAAPAAGLGKVRKLKEPNDVDQSSGHASENEFDVRKARS